MSLENTDFIFIHVWANFFTERSFFHKIDFAAERILEVELDTDKFKKPAARFVEPNEDIDITLGACLTPGNGTKNIRFCRIILAENRSRFLFNFFERRHA